MYVSSWGGKLYRLPWGNDTEIFLYRTDFFKEAGVNQGPDGSRVRTAVEQFGGVCDGGGNTHLVFSVPVSFGFPAVEALFNDLMAEYIGSSWLFGNVYDPWNDFKPLGWWEQRNS